MLCPMRFRPYSSLVLSDSAERSKASFHRGRQDHLHGLLAKRIHAGVLGYRSKTNETEENAAGKPQSGCTGNPERGGFSCVQLKSPLCHEWALKVDITKHVGMHEILSMSFGLADKRPERVSKCLSKATRLRVRSWRACEKSANPWNAGIRVEATRDTYSLSVSMCSRPTRDSASIPPSCRLPGGRGKPGEPTG